MDGTLLEQIKPGEFTFCSRCGENVHYGKKEFMCSQCKANLFGHKVDEEELLRWRYETRLSEIIRQHREDLAKLRLQNLEKK